MEMIKVNSSNVVAIGHDGSDLYVQYASGTYRYVGVSKQLFEGLKNADSKGKFMNQYIKDSFKCERLREAK